MYVDFGYLHYIIHCNLSLVIAKIAHHLTPGLRQIVEPCKCYVSLQLLLLVF